MIFTCEKSVLQSAVTITARAAAARSPIPALEGLLIEAANGLRITGYDLKKGIYTEIESDIMEQGSIIVNAKVFGDIVRSLPSGVVSVSTEKGLQIKISCGNSEFSIMGIDPADYPELPSIDYESSISISQKTIKSMISETLFAVSDNDSRPVYTGSLFEIENDELTVVSVDGYRLALRRESIDRCDVEKTSFIVPGNALSDIERICSDEDDPVRITVGKKQVFFNIGSTVLITRRLEGEFLNYRRSIADNFAYEVIAEKEVLTKVIERVSLIIDDKVKNPLRCTFGDGEIDFLCVTPIGKAVDVCPIDGDGGNTEIGFNNRYILDAVKTAPASSLKICINSSSMPCIIKPDDGSDKFLYMVLPVRLKAGE